MPESPEDYSGNEVVDPDVDLHDPAQLTPTAGGEWSLLLAIAIGGALGAVARYGVSQAIQHRPSGWPWSTLLINVSGCLAIGLLMAAVLAAASPPRLLRPFLGVGILGGYTTYSSFAVDAVSLLDHHQPGLAIGYVATTLMGGAAAVWVGRGIGQLAFGPPAEVSS